MSLLTGSRSQRCSLFGQSIGLFIDYCSFSILMCTMTVREPLIHSHMAATAAWQDEMQDAARNQGLFSLTGDVAQQFARQALSCRACFARYQRGGCGQIGRSLASTAWCQSPGYDLRCTRRDLPDLTCNAAHGGINQWSLGANAVGCRPIQFWRMSFGCLGCRRPVAATL